MFPHAETAATALYLGCKVVENTARPCNQIAEALLEAVEFDQPSKDVIASVEDQIKILEDLMLVTLAYDIKVDHPIRYINEACEMFNITNGKTV